MADNDLSKMLETQISLTEWLAKIGHADADELRDEDNVKRIRIGQMSEIIGIPFDKPTTFPAIDLVQQTDEFKQFLAERGDELCALRLIPKKGKKAEKLRNRGKSIKDSMEWFAQQQIDPELYDADFVPHFEDYSWATIFVVNDKGIFGEIFYGGHHNLTQRLYKDQPPYTFGYDYTQWTISPTNDDALSYLRELVAHVHVPDTAKQRALTEVVKAEFTHDYIKGYFESVHSPTVGTWFIDYNRLLGKRYEDYVVTKDQNIPNDTAVVRGRVASAGAYEGVVRVIADPLKETVEPGEVLVCAMTTPDFIPHMLKAGAIVTDQGGILCHAAIVARELKKPCIVGTGTASTLLKTGDRIVLDTTGGITKK